METRDSKPGVKKERGQGEERGDAPHVGDTCEAPHHPEPTNYFRRLLGKIRHPFSGLSHLVGAILALVGLVTLQVAAWGNVLHLVSFTVYGVTLVLLYFASAFYHLLRVPPRVEQKLYALDRAAIYALIAGTYTPVCLLALPPAWGWSLLAAVWGMAIIGILTDILSRQKTPDWLQAVLYLLTGWIVLVAVGPLVASMPLAGLLWLLAGSLIYTVGAVICVTERPRLLPGRFGAHDLWHVLTMAGSACHFVLMLGFFAPR